MNTQAIPAVEDSRIPRRLALGWALGSFAMSAMFQANTVLLLSYLVNFVGIAAVTAGLLLGLSKIYDATVDPFIGLMSDRTVSRWGRRRPYILIGGLICGLSFWLLFSIPLLEDLTLRTAIVAFALLANATGYAMFVIPYIAMPAEMTDSARERAYLMSLRVAAVALGQIIGSFVGPQLIAAYGGGLAGHRVMAAVVALVVIVTCIACFFATKNARFTTRVIDHGYSLGQQFRLAAGNQPFVCLMGMKTLNLFGLAVTTAITPFLFIQLLKTSYSVMGYYFLVKSIGTFVTQPLWLKMSNSLGKKPTFYIASAMYAAGNLSFLTAEAGEPIWALYARGILLGVSAGGLLLVGQTLLPETIAYDFKRTGLRREGIFAGVYTTVEKTAFALAAAATGLVLGSMGYIESTGSTVEQSERALLAIYICIGAPAVLQLFSSVILSRYRLDDIPAPVVPKAVAAE